DSELAGQAPGPIGLDNGAQVLAFEELHDYVRTSVILTKVVDPDDIGMFDIRCQARFPQEAASPFRVGSPIGCQDFYRHGFPDHGIPGAINMRHAASEVLFYDVISNSLRMFQLCLSHLNTAARQCL